MSEFESVESVSFPPPSLALLEEGSEDEGNDVEEEEEEDFGAEVLGVLLPNPLVLLLVEASDEVLDRELTQRLLFLAESPSSSSSSSSMGGGHAGKGGGTSLSSDVGLFLLVLLLSFVEGGATATGALALFTGGTLGVALATVVAVVEAVGGACTWGRGGSAGRRKAVGGRWMM